MWNRGVRLVTLGVADLGRARSFYEGLGWSTSADVGDDVAFGDSLNRISGTRTDGEETDVWVRATIGCRKIDGKWMIAHEHASVPFHMDGSYKAAVDLEP